MTHTNRRTRTILANLSALALTAGVLLLTYRESTEFADAVAAAFGLSLLVSLIVDRVERRRPPIGTVLATATLGIACNAYLIGDLIIDSTAVRGAAMVLAYAGLVALLLRLQALLRSH